MTNTGEGGAEDMRSLSDLRARQIGSAPFVQKRAQHTYAHSVAEFEAVWEGLGSAVTA